MTAVDALRTLVQRTIGVDEIVRQVASVNWSAPSVQREPLPVEQLRHLTNGHWSRGAYKLPYGLELAPRGHLHDLAKLGLDVGLTVGHDSLHGAPATFMQPRPEADRGRIFLSWRAFSGFTPRKPYVRPLTEAGLTFMDFPFPPELREFVSLDWDTALPITVDIARRQPEFLQKGLIGFGYSQGGIIAARWAELASWTDTTEKFAKRLLCYQRMTPSGQKQFIQDLEWLADKLREIGFKAYSAGSPHGGIPFTESSLASPLRAAVNRLNPHLVPSYEPDHLAKFSGAALAGQVLVVDDAARFLRTASPAQLAVGIGMRAVFHVLSLQDGSHDGFVSRASSFVAGVPFVEYRTTHLRYPSDPGGAKALLSLMEPS